MNKNRTVEILAVIASILTVCSIAIGGMIETVKAPPAKDVATAYAETLLPGKQYRVVCSDERTPSFCAIVHENNGSVTVILIRCGHSIGSCAVRGNQ